MWSPWGVARLFCTELTSVCIAARPRWPKLFSRQRQVQGAPSAGTTWWGPWTTPQGIQLPAGLPAAARGAQPREQPLGLGDRGVHVVTSRMMLGPRRNLCGARPLHPGSLRPGPPGGGAVHRALGRQLLSLPPQL